MDDVKENNDTLPQNLEPSQPINLNSNVAKDRNDLSGFCTPTHNAIVTLNVRPSTEDNWQSRKNTMNGRLSFLLFNKIMSDVTFIVGTPNEHICGHKFILAIGSSVFEAMFYRMLATRSNEIEIPDIEPAVFRNLLRFIYTDKVTIEASSVMATLYAAKKYAVSILEAQCVCFLEKSLSTDTAFFLLAQARLFDIEQLITLCLHTIDRHTPRCLSSKCFLEIDNCTLNAVLSRDTLCIREIGLYQAVIRWSQSECRRRFLTVNPHNQLTVLKNCAKLIRYPLMSSQEFAAGPAQDGLLTEKQMIQLFLYFNLDPKPTSEFSDRPRSAMSGHESICICSSKVERNCKKITQKGKCSKLCRPCCAPDLFNKVAILDDQNRL